MKALLAVFLLSGCATGAFAPATLNRHFASRTPAEKIEIFTERKPARKFVEIGAATSCCSRDPNLLIRLLRKQAEELGGDALIDFEFSASGQAVATVIRFP